VYGLGRPRWRWIGSRGGRLLCAMAVTALLAWPPPAIKADGPGWQVVPTTAGPGPRAQYGMAADASGHIYLYGGNAGLDTPLSDFWAYDTTLGRWQMLVNDTVPALVEPHLAVDEQGNVWEFGGIADPRGPHLTEDGHSFGLYEYQPTLGAWTDRTPRDAQAGLDWPPGREDFGFAFDSRNDDLVVFGGEGEDEAMLNDLWTYSVRSAGWTSVTQHYVDSAGASIAPIAPRELYNISADNHGEFYLFGGTFLVPPFGAGINGYANDLWRYDDADKTWTLLAGIANDYDPRMPVPRHYYGQTVDAGGDFDVLGGYLSEPGTLPFFSGDVTARYALPFQFSTGPEAGSYGLTDFWRFDPISGWQDASAELDSLGASPIIPYVLVFDQVTNRLYTFGGYHLDSDGLLATSNTLWSLSEDGLGIPVPIAAAVASTTPRSAAAVASTTPRSAVGARPSATAGRSATPSPSPTPAQAAHLGAAVTPPVRATAALTLAAKPSSATVRETILAGSYRLALAIGPPQHLYSQAQIRARHPSTGEVLLNGTAPSAGTAIPNHYLELHVYSAANGTPISAVAVTLIVTTPQGRTLQRVPAVAMQRVAVGSADRHFGDNLALPAGHYHVAVHAGQASAVFDVHVGA
jgi:hypothetical protein